MEPGKVKSVWRHLIGGGGGGEVEFIAILIFSHAFANKA